VFLSFYLTSKSCNKIIFLPANNCWNYLTGFDGQAGWINDRFALDSDYYRGLLRLGWNSRTQDNSNFRPIPDQFFWRRNNQDIILMNADAALTNNFEGRQNTNTGAVSCGFATTNNNGGGRCPFSNIRDYAVAFDDGNDGNELWLDVFEPTFKKMLVNGYLTGACEYPPCQLTVEG